MDGLVEQNARAIERKVTICGLDYAYKSWGHHDAPIILAFHGWLDNANSFDVVGPILAEKYRVLSFDLMGHGLSGHLPQWRYYHYADVLADAAELLALWADEAPVVLLGHSLGGAVVACLAAMYPEKVSAVVTIDALGPLVGALESLPEKMAQAALARGRWHKRSPRITASFSHMVDARMRGEWPITETAAKLLCERGVESVTGGYRWRADPRWKSPSVMRLCEAQVQAILCKIRCPCLLAIAEAGLLQNMDDFEARKACIPDLRLKTFRGGHHLHMEVDAVPFAQWVMQVLNG
jgi:pimeloyl-ACP methyl ester carboxylesterase